MRKTSSLPALSLFSIAIIFCCSLVAVAQNREKFVISAKAGGINAVTGQASVHSRGETDWHQLMITDDLDAGDRVRTAYEGRVEILLNPGSYLRLGGNSEVELSDNTLANLEVRLLRGTAIVEATGADGLELNISISTPHTKLAIVRQGLYRVSVVPGDATELIVRKGRVILSDSHTKVKGGDKVVFSATVVSVAKLSKEEKKEQDREEVAVWSKERARTLAKANSKLTDRMINSAFASFRDSNDPFLISNRTGLGFWVYNTRVGCYTFLPFFYGWGSPYGGSYPTAVYSPWQMPSAYRPGGNPQENNGSNGTFPAGGGGASAGNSPRQTPPTTSPIGASPGGGSTREPRMINPETGNAMPRKNLERMPNN